MFCTLSKCRDNAPNNAIVQAGAPPDDHTSLHLQPALTLQLDKLLA